MPPRPEKRARTDEGEDFDDDEDDALDDGMDDDMDEDNDDDDEHDAEAEVDAETAAVLSLATATDMGLNENPGTNTGPEMPLPNEKIVDYCYRKGYFPASVPFPKATITTRFMEAPLIPLRPLEKNPNNKRLWNGKKPVNWCAALLQVGGAELTEPCTRCTEGNGLWKKCVVPNDWATSWNVRGACANCYVDGLRGKCSRGFGYAIPNSSQNSRSKANKAKAAAAAAANASAGASTGAGGHPPNATPTRRSTAAPNMTAPAPAPPPAPPSNTPAAHQGAATFTNAAFTPTPGPAVVNATGPSPNGRPYNPNNRDFESYKREYNNYSKVDLDRLADHLATERARISLQLAALDSVRAAREAFQNYYPEGSDALPPA